MDRERGNLIYGEIQYQGLIVISNEIRKTAELRKSIFTEIGSGFGKGCRVIAELNSIYCNAVELDSDKHEIAKKISYSNQLQLIKYINEDIRKIPKILNKSDYVYCNNWTYHKNLNRFIWENLKKGCEYFVFKIDDLEDVLTNDQKNSINKFGVKVSWLVNGIQCYKLIK